MKAETFKFRLFKAPTGKVEAVEAVIGVSKPIFLEALFEGSRKGVGMAKWFLGRKEAPNA